MAPITLTEFPTRVLDAFPELREAFEYDDGLAYVQMGGFAELMQQAKGRGDWDVYARAAALVDQLWADADAGLRNAVHVSLLERLDFAGPHGPKAWSLLSPRLQRAWRAMAAYNEWLRSGAKGPPPRGA